MFFDEFLAQQKVDSNLLIWLQRAFEKRDTQFLVGVGGRGGVPGRRKRRGYVAGEHSVKGLARRSTGGGGSMGYRLFRRPPILFFFAFAIMC